MKRANGESHADGPGEKRSNDGAPAAPPLYQPSLEFRLELIIEDMSDEDAPLEEVFGPFETIGSARWSLSAEAESKNGRDVVAVYINCLCPGAAWRLMMDYTARVVGTDVQKVGRGVKMAKRITEFAYAAEECHVFLVDMQELLDPADGYLTDDTFTMEVDVTIYEPYRMLVDFFTADSNYNADGVLRVQDRRFHVNKEYKMSKRTSESHLGHESAFFYQWFFGPFEECSRGEIALEDVGADEFLQFLGAIHRMRAPITEVNVELLIKLADRFQVVWLVGDCEDFLLGSSSFTVAEQLIISTRLNIDELRKKCMDDMTLADVNELIDMEEESATDVKLDGRLLQELLGKQKELMEDKHERAMKARKDDH